MLACCFAVSPEGQSAPAAIFSDVEDAISFGLEKFGSDGFRIRHCPVLEISSDCPQGMAAGEDERAP